MEHSILPHYASYARILSIVSPRRSRGAIQTHKPVLTLANYLTNHRLNDVLASINSEIGELESCHANIDFVSKIWTGAAQNLALNSTIPSTQQKE
eukprot:1394930-Amorphochlora_amoeboformis.AAC.1